MKSIVIATMNEGKKRDFEALFQPMGIEVKTLHDFKEAYDVEETGTTFEENAILKAEAMAHTLQFPVIADDSGLEIDALNGAPGVYSARYAGDHDDEKNIDKVFEQLQGIPVSKRTARFVCVLAVARPNQKTLTFRGTCEGVITEERQGTNGFGYDPIFYVPNQLKTMAQLEPSEKSAISHRGAALQQLQQEIQTILK